jgi:sec-independent protein translocase protein TatC
MFELPVICFFLGKLGVIDSAGMGSTFRYAIVAIFIIATIIAPPDVVSQCLIALPICGLYTISYYVVKLSEKYAPSTENTENKVIE